jgi:hypothetical protein
MENSGSTYNIRLTRTIFDTAECITGLSGDKRPATAVAIITEKVGFLTCGSS